MLILAAYLFLGAVAGLIAGIFGLGGGIVIVPALIFTFSYLGFNPDILTHLAIGTSLTTIFFTSLSSIYVHYKKRAINWPLVYKLSIGMFFGGFIGAYAANFLSGIVLQNIFACYALFVAIQMWFSLYPKASYPLPQKFGCIFLGGIVGTLSGLFGIGGGSIMVPVLIFYKVNIAKAVASASVTGFPIAIAGATGYLWSGLNVTQLPEHSFGYIYWPAVLGIAITSTYFAKLGAKITHGMNPKLLKNLFSLLMICVSIKLFLS